MHIKHAFQKLKHLEKEEKKQIIAKKMGGSKLSHGQWPEAKVPSQLKAKHPGKGEKHTWEKHGHKQPEKSWEI